MMMISYVYCLIKAEYEWEGIGYGCVFLVECALWDSSLLCMEKPDLILFLNLLLLVVI